MTLMHQPASYQDAPLALMPPLQLEWLPDLSAGQPACIDYDPDLFFADLPADVEAAKSICRTCPVQELCFQAAVRRREPFGVWGGQLFVQGVVVARKRPRGRPRKNPVEEVAA